MTFQNECTNKKYHKYSFIKVKTNRTVNSSCIIPAQDNPLGMLHVVEILSRQMAKLKKIQSHSPHRALVHTHNMHTHTQYDIITLY